MIKFSLFSISACACCRAALCRLDLRQYAPQPRFDLAIIKLLFRSKDDSHYYHLEYNYSFIKKKKQQHAEVKW